MHKALAGKNFRGRPAPRSGFSLVELVVSIGILALMVSLAGQVMSLTVRSTGQAKALTEVNQVLRGLEQTLREDLANVPPIGESLLLIQGNPISAYKTAAQREAQQLPPREELPRADILMFFTARPANSYVRPEVSSGLQQVVYGHAELGTYVLDLGPPREYTFVPLVTPPAEMFPFDPDELVSLQTPPAENWHLARRSVLLVQNPAPIPLPPGWLEYDPVNPASLVQRLNAPEVLRGETDIVANFKYEENVLTPSFIDGPGTPGGWPWYWPPIFDRVDATQWGEPFARSQLDPSPPPQVADRLGHYFLPNCASFKVEWTLDPRSEFVGGKLDGEKEVYWFDPGALRDPGPPVVEADPLETLRQSTEYECTEKCEDIEPGVETPRCVRLCDLLELKRNGGQQSATKDERYSLKDRFLAELPDPIWHLHPYGEGLPRPNLVVFAANRRMPPTGVPGDVVREDVFPSALRITVEVYDKARRLERPIRHVMIIPVGG